MSLVDEVTAEIIRMSMLSMVNSFFMNWLKIYDFEAEKLTDDELEELIKAIHLVTSKVNSDEDEDDIE